MKKLISAILFCTMTALIICGCNSEQTTTDKNTSSKIEEQTDVKETTSTTAPTNYEYSNYIAPTAKKGTEYIKTNIVSLEKRDNETYTPPAIEEDVSGAKGDDKFGDYLKVSYWKDNGDKTYLKYDIVYDNKGNVILDGSELGSNVQFNGFYNDYTVLRIFETETSEVKYYIYNIKTKEKKEIQNVYYANLKNGYIIFQEEDLSEEYGAMDLDLNIIFPCNYSYIGPMDKDSFVIGNSSGNYGVMNSKGETIIDFDYYYMYPFTGRIYSISNIVSYLITDDEQNYCEYTAAYTNDKTKVIIDRKGNIVYSAPNDKHYFYNLRAISQYLGKTRFSLVYAQYNTDGENLKNYIIEIDENGNETNTTDQSERGYINGYNIGIDFNGNVFMKDINGNNILGETLTKIVTENHDPSSSINDVLSSPDQCGFFIVTDKQANSSTIYDLALNKVYSSEDSLIEAYGNGFFSDGKTIFSITEKN